MTYPLTPHRDKVILKKEDLESVTSTGLIIPGAQTEGPVKGTVLAVGSGRIDQGVICPMDVQPGDTVYYVQGKGIDIDRDGAEIVVAEDNIVAKVVGDKLTPYWDKALIELVKEESTTASGLIKIADTEEGYDMGTVLAVGPGYLKKGFRIPNELNEGDEVLFNQYMGVEIEVEVEDSRRLFLVREYDVYGVVQ